MVKKKPTTKKKTTTANNDVLVKDFKNSILVVSVLINVAIFTAWIALKVTTVYDDQVAQILFTR